ncbi:MAG: hypothetical protein M1817_006280 [Caeruleum heppii]|nr:MAG: hypothetical protein M1817_006280 [Caeruleum heppii]
MGAGQECEEVAQMSSPPDAEDAGEASRDGGDKEASTGARDKAKQSRKRTKTGCLTCRRRRIKCGEERPICNNCIKSKRNCEGYNQRVIFKDPMSGFRPAGPGVLADIATNAPHFHHGPGPRPADGSPYGGLPSSSVPGQGTLQAIAPRPPQGYAYSVVGGLPTPPGLHSDGSIASIGVTSSAPRYPQSDLPPRLRQLYQDPSFPISAFSDPATANWLGAGQTHGQPGQPQPGSRTGHDLQTPIDGWPPSAFPRSQQSNVTSTPAYQSLSQTDQSRLDQFLSPIEDSNLPGGLAGQSAPTETVNSPQNEQVVSPAAGKKDWETATATRSSTAAALPYADFPPAHSTSAASVIQSMSGRQFAPLYTPPLAAPFQEDDDGPYDVESDDDMDLEIEVANAAAQRDLSNGHEQNLMVAVQSGHDERSMRSFRSCLGEANILATYRPSPAASPLMDYKTARIFCHFISATGPSLSLFERVPVNPSLIFTQTALSLSQRSLWSYTLPTMALTSPPLLHAMLALASLHIAKLQGGTTVPSMKHYHMALRRVAKYVSLPAKRGEIATLAATLLLGFWEIMASEHTKWNSHLLGARQLLIETDFAGMTKRVEADRARNAGVQDPYFQSHTQQVPRTPWGRSQSDSACLGIDPEVDLDLVNLLMGQKPGKTSPQQKATELKEAAMKAAPLSSKDIEDYRIRSDLFWWFLKQDLFQGLLSGNNLLLQYERWSHCPPRAPIGRLEAPYGTYDHLILVMGRIADFAANDQKRKRMVAESAGAFKGLGQMASPVSPPTGGSSGPPASAEKASDATCAPSAPGPPPSMMYGMIPPTAPTQMPTAFKFGQDSAATQIQQDELELEAATTEALEEWNDIKQALQVFEECLGPHYQPLPPEYVQPLSTPFGPALCYKTQAIACILSSYNMAQIILHRVHPSMPPAAMMAAGFAARKTARYANEIGRIAGGVLPSIPNSQVSPSLGAALIEVTMSLFFAGVQFQDPAQRGWTVTKLQDVARLTGWETCLAIASGCESAWEKAAQYGRGPPYSRTLNPLAKDDRVAGRRPGDDSPPPKDNTDRRLVSSNPETRVHWAIGLLGVEEDLGKLDLDKKKRT